MNCQPSSIRILASSMLKVWIPAGTLIRLQPARMSASACLKTSGWGGLPDRIAHARGQVVGPDEDGVDAGDGVHRVEVADRVDVLALQDDEEFVVGAGVVLGRRGREVEGMDAAADGAIAPRRIETGRHRVWRPPREW